MTFDVSKINTLKNAADFTNCYGRLMDGINDNKLLELRLNNDPVKFRLARFKILETRVVVNNKLAAKAGRARMYPYPLIELHPGLLDPNDIVFADAPNTLLHEAAHIIACIIDLKKGQGHGWIWHYCMVQLGFPNPEKEITYNPRIWDYKGYKTRKTKRQIAHIEKDLGDLF